MPPRFDEPVLTIAVDAVAKVDGDQALHDLWAVFTRCKESLQDGRRLENIAWRLWAREHSPFQHVSGSPDSNASLVSCGPQHLALRVPSPPPPITSESESAGSEEWENDGTTPNDENQALVSPPPLASPPPSSSSTTRRRTQAGKGRTLRPLKRISTPTVKSKPPATASATGPSRRGSLQPPARPSAAIRPTISGLRTQSAPAEVPLLPLARRSNASFGSIISSLLPEKMAVYSPKKLPLAILTSSPTTVVSRPTTPTSSLVVITDSASTPALILTNPTPRPTPPGTPHIARRTIPSPVMTLSSGTHLLPPVMLSPSSPTAISTAAIPDKSLPSPADPAPPNHAHEQDELDKEKIFFIPSPTHSNGSVGAGGVSSSSSDHIQSHDHSLIREEPSLPVMLPNGLFEHPGEVLSSVSSGTNTGAPTITATIRKGKAPAKHVTSRGNLSHRLTIGRVKPTAKLAAAALARGKTTNQTRTNAPTKRPTLSARTSSTLSAQSDCISVPALAAVPTPPAPREPSPPLLSPPVFAPAPPPPLVPPPVPVTRPYQPPPSRSPPRRSVAPQPLGSSLRANEATSSDFETTSTDADSCWDTSDEDDIDDDDRERERQRGILARQATIEAERQRNLFAKVPTRSLSDISRHRKTGLLTELLNPDPAIFQYLPSATGNTTPHPRQHHQSAQNLRSGPAPPPALTRIKTTAAIMNTSSGHAMLAPRMTSSKSAADVRLAPVTVTPEGPLAATTSARSNLRLQGCPEGAQLETDDDDDDDDVVGAGGIPKSLAQRKLEALSHRGVRAGSGLSASRAGKRSAEDVAPTQGGLLPAAPPPSLSTTPRQASILQIVETANATAIPIAAPQVPIPVPLPHPYNLPALAVPQTPRTTRRAMLASEMTESLRRNLLWERQTSKRMYGTRGRGALSGLQPLTNANSGEKSTGPEGDYKSGDEAERQKERERKRSLIARNRSWEGEYHAAGW